MAAMTKSERRTRDCEKDSGSGSVSMGGVELSLTVQTFMLLPCGLSSSLSGYADNRPAREGPTTLTASMHDADGVLSVCVGSGQGVALVLENPRVT
jgi:hypothetical protein